MNKGKVKGVRQYGRAVYSLRWGKYHAHEKLVLLIGMLALYLPFFGVGMGLSYLSASIIARLHLSPSANRVMTYFGWPLIIIAVGTISLTTTLLILDLCFRNTDTRDTRKGRFLNPVLPEENSLLPDEELLVRASSSATQPAELLRAVQETTEEKPEELLRTGMRNPKG